MRIRRVWKGLWICGLAGLLLGGCTLLHGTLAVLHVSQTQGTVPFAISFDASDSNGADGITTYHWTFGDGTDSYEVSGTHTYNHVGQYTIGLTVRVYYFQTDGQSCANLTLNPLFPSDLKQKHQWGVYRKLLLMFWMYYVSSL